MKFTQEFFVRNRRQLMKAIDTELMVITANGVLQRNGDVTYRFRQDSSFWYLTGIEKPDIILVIDRKKEYLILPERDEVIQKFDGLDDPAGLSRVSGIETVYDQKSGWQCLEKSLKKTKHVATFSALPSYIERHGLYTNPARSHLCDRIMGINPDVELVDVRQDVTRMRAIKQPAELKAIQKAIDITANILQKVSKARATYAYEYEIEADITASFKRLGYDHAFSPIVASGQNASTIHHIANDGPIHTDDLLILDIGAEVSHYAADISRTYAVGTPTRRQKAVFDAVLDVQKYGMSLLQPGIMMKEYEQKIEAYMGDKLLELGLIKTASKAEIRAYYPHATSHFLGLDTHDVGEYDRPLAPGMVLTVEPGIYIPEEGLGVRIEDDVLITKTGLKNLSEKLPVTL